MNDVLQVAHFTLRELIRSKMVYVWLVCATALCGLAFLLSLLSYGDILQIFMDLGLVGMELSGLLVLILSLAVTYNTEMDQKAIYLQMVRPLTRGEYLLGRILGFFGIIALVVLGMGLVVVGLVVFVGGGQVPVLFYSCVAFLLMEMFVLSVLGLTFQMIGTSMVGVVLYAFFTIFLGHCIGQVEWLMGQHLAPVVKWALQIVYICLPNLEIFNLKDRIYDPTFVLTWVQWKDVLIYTGAYSLSVFLIGWLSLEKREFR